MSLEDLSESDQRVYANVTAKRAGRSQKTNEIARALYEFRPAGVDITEATIHHMVTATHNMEILSYMVRRGVLFRIAYDYADLLSDDLGDAASLESAPHTLYFPGLHLYGAYTDAGWLCMRTAWKLAVEAGTLSKDECVSQILITSDAIDKLVRLVD